MTRIESSIVVPKTQEAIFSFLNRCESHLKFIPRMTELKQTSPGAFGRVGTTLSGVLKYFGIRIPVQYEIIEVEPGQRLAMRGKMGPVEFRDGYILNEQNEATEIRFWLDLLPTSWVRILSPFMGLVGRIHAWETLRNLKRELMSHQIASQGDASQSSVRSSQ